MPKSEGAQITPYQRSGQTKRERTRAALIAAAAEVFTERGWLDSHLEHIARTAGSSVPTMYNHFPGGKQELIGVVYAPLLEPLLLAAEADIAAAVDPVEAVTRHVHRLTILAGQRQQLTLTMLAAAHGQTILIGQPTKDNDVRMLVPMTRPLIGLIAYGQEQGAFTSEYPASEIGAYHTNAILIRLTSRPLEAAKATAELVLSQLLPALTASR